LALRAVNIRAFVIQDRGQFGVIKILVNDPESGRAALSDAGFACALRPVLAVVVNDAPGGLLSLVELLASRKINLVDAYGFVLRSGEKAVACIEVDNTETVSDVLAESGFLIVSEKELYDL
jgi:hypothetical protein